jgi:Cdc6-like AAA superfamily ATPase
VAEYVSKLAQLEDRAETIVSKCAYTAAQLAQGELRGELQKLEIALHAPVMRVESRLGELLQLAESVERGKILQWISAVHHETDHYNAQKGRQDGTGDWLLARRHYLKWRDSPTSTTLWLHGIPGAGKTKLSSKVVDAVLDRLSDERNQETLAYFYCDANRSTHNTSLALTRSLVKQLSTPSPCADDRSIIPAVADSYRGKRSKDFRQTGSPLRTVRIFSLSSSISTRRLRL